MEHPALRRLRAALDERAFNDQMAIIKARNLQQSLSDLLELDHPAVECAIDYGYLLEDLASTSVNIGPCQLKIAVFNVSEPETERAEHVVMVYVGPTKVSQRMVTLPLFGPEHNIPATMMLQSQLMRLGNAELLSQYLQELSDELEEAADRLEQQAREKRAEAVKIANLLKQ